MFSLKKPNIKPTITEKKEVKQTTPPKFRSAWSAFGQKKIDIAVGMDISDSSIELLELKPFFTHRPQAYSRIALENGIVSRGKIVNKDILTDKIKVLLKNARPNKISTNRVVLSLPESQVFTWSVAISKSISGSELKKMIFDEARKVVPLDFKKIYWDFAVYPLSQKELQYVTFVGIHQDILNDYVEVCNRVGLEIVDFSLICTNLARVFLPYSDRDDYILFDIGGSSSTVSVIGGNRLLKLSVTLAVGGDALTKAIAESMKVTLLEAEQLKVRFGISDGPSASYKNAVENTLNDLLKQVNQTISYYEKNTGETVDAVYLTGGGSLLNGIDAFIAKSTGKTIQPLASLPFITKSPIFNKEINLKLFANAVGLAVLGISNDTKMFSFRKKILINDHNMNFYQILKTGYFSKTGMIFSYTHVVYAVLVLVVVALTTTFTLMWLSIPNQ